jgi:serine/threonine-protein kinase RsbW
MTKANITFTRDIDAEPGALRDLRRDLRSCVQELLPEDLTTDLLLAATEAFTNVVRHAYPAGRTGTCHVELSWEGSFVELVIEDEGEGFDPAWCYADHTQDESGRGFLIIRAVTDEFMCELTNRGGARLVMRKRVRNLDQPASASDSERAEQRLSRARGTGDRRHDLSDLADADG